MMKCSKTLAACLLLLIAFACTATAAPWSLQQTWTEGEYLCWDVKIVDYWGADNAGLAYAVAIPGEDTKIRIRYRYWNGTAWSGYVTVATEEWGVYDAGNVTHVSLAFDDEGYPAIAWSYTGMENSFWNFHASFKRASSANGSSWNTAVVPLVDLDQVLTGWMGSPISLEYDAQDKPHILVSHNVESTWPPQSYLWHMPGQVAHSADPWFSYWGPPVYDNRTLLSPDPYAELVYNSSGNSYKGITDINWYRHPQTDALQAAVQLCDLQDYGWACRYSPSSGLTVFSSYTYDTYTTDGVFVDVTDDGIDVLSQRVGFENVLVHKVEAGTNVQVAPSGRVYCLLAPELRYLAQSAIAWEPVSTYPLSTPVHNLVEYYTSDDWQTISRRPIISGGFGHDNQYAYHYDVVAADGNWLKKFVVTRSSIGNLIVYTR